MTVAEAVRQHLPPLAKRKDPTLAATIGLLTGGIGLAIYFRSLRDLLLVELMGMLVIVGSLIAGVQPTDAIDVALLPVMIVGGSYGRWRATSSNRRLAAPRVASGLVGSAG